jgi:hypothetical protein
VGTAAIGHPQIGDGLLLVGAELHDGRRCGTMLAAATHASLSP